MDQKEVDKLVPHFAHPRWEAGGWRVERAIARRAASALIDRLIASGDANEAQLGYGVKYHDECRYALDGQRALLRRASEAGCDVGPSPFNYHLQCTILHGHDAAECESVLAAMATGGIKPNGYTRSLLDMHKGAPSRLSALRTRELMRLTRAGCSHPDGGDPEAAAAAWALFTALVEKGQADRFQVSAATDAHLTSYGN